MKKFLSMTLLFTAMFLTFSACSSDDETNYPDITGSWSKISETPGEYISSYREGISINVNGGWVNITEYPYTKFAFSIKFNSDGTYSGRGYFGNGSGTYTAKGKTIITYVNGKEYLRYEVKSLSNNIAELSMTVDGSGETLEVKAMKK